MGAQRKDVAGADNVAGMGVRRDGGADGGEVVLGGYAGADAFARPPGGSTQAFLHFFVTFRSTAYKNDRIYVWMFRRG
jgi:hypothetical protein